MAELIIVDGYNIIYQDPIYQKAKEASLELARVKLIEDLANYQSYSGHKVIVVFDAAQQEIRSERKGNVLGVEVIFTKKGESADTCIESLAFRANSERTTIVATSDHGLQRVVFGKGVYRRTPGELASEIMEAKEEWREHVKQPPPHFLEDRLDKEVREKLRALMVSSAKTNSSKD